ILHAHYCGAGAYAQKAALCAIYYLDGDVVPVQAQLSQGGGQSLVLGLAGLFKIFFHAFFSCSSSSSMKDSSTKPSSSGSAGVSGTASAEVSGTLSSTSLSMLSPNSLSAAAARV